METKLSLMLALQEPSSTAPRPKEKQQKSHDKRLTDVNMFVRLKEAAVINGCAADNNKCTLFSSRKENYMSRSHVD